MSPTEPLRVALLARPGVANDRLREVIVQAGANAVLEHDPTLLELSVLRQANPQVLLVALDPVTEEALDRFESVLFDPAIDVIYEEAELAASREGWEVARWQRHLVAKLQRHEDVLPPGREPDEAPDPMRVPEEGAGAPATGMGQPFAFETDAASVPVLEYSYAFDPVAAEGLGDVTGGAATDTVATFAEGRLERDDALPSFGFDPAAAEHAQSPDVSAVGGAADAALGFAPVPAALIGDGDGDSDSYSGREGGRVGDGTVAALPGNDGTGAGFDPVVAEVDSHGVESAVTGAAGFAALDPLLSEDTDFAVRDAALVENTLGGRDENGQSAAADSPGAVEAPAAVDTDSAARGSFAGFGELTLDDGSGEMSVAEARDAKNRFERDLGDLEQRIAGLELVDDTPDPGQAAQGAVLVLAGIGGPDAVRQLLGALPHGFGRPVLVQQRLEGGRYDKLVTQMQRATTLPVHLAQSGDPVHPGFVYILPAVIGLRVESAALHFDESGDVLAALPASDSAVLMLSGADAGLVDAIMNERWGGAFVAGQAAEGCYDPTAANALGARGADTGQPAEIAARLASRWAS